MRSTALTRRGGTALAVTAAAALALTGCSSSDAGSADPDEKIVLEYGIWDQKQEPAMQAIADAFTAENPNVSIKLVTTPYKEYFTKLQTSVSGGAAPDVFWMNGPNFQLYASNGVIAPLEGADLDPADYPEGLVDLYTFDGALYGAPKDFDTIGLWYNKELFDEAGVAYPTAGWTWDDMKDAAAKLTDPAKGQFGIAAAQAGQENYYNSIAQAGGEVISADGTTSGYGTPEALAGIELWTDLIEAGSSPTAQQMTDTSAQDFFLSGKVAMFQNGSWAAHTYADNADIADKVDVAPLAAGPAGNQSVIHGLANVVNAKGDHVEAATEFAVFASSEAAADIMADSGTVIPAFDGKQQVWVDALPQYNLQAYIDALDTAVAYPASQNTAAWTSVEGEILSQVWAGNVTPADGLQELASKMQAALDSE
ncbi:sugar ABC transporter substrate-binding protein [Microbacterium esteraromaticum]|uniref:Sugar ABC transporter substrate-binding protein n=1 Tax=Microbacterium esteraromaticum TaxID=57043 RepID=A0A939ISC2_9MICO|nr:sugar ABC transporter substrate-binding protein [Microbacterium esteraromaticum]MBN8205027.1 sugar ABC transporter substrate-binding protein [Microbacterium esteraromaticum]MBN8415181.1 sugar ABC transporter substrate-binding protein [Microbacterium esteraromaticum]MBN8424541.1 sugar ABC transporter substrate-binding protein [Microbacterium esteraromaticum]MBY6059986.1 sugar ABC transporter substrate-binding protein [Microbacterium esteraromaticum]WDH79167.1 sugar ABC transporter substrate-